MPSNVSIYLFLRYVGLPTDRDEQLLQLWQAWQYPVEN